MPAGVGDVPAPDQPKPPVNARVCLVAERGNSDLRQPRVTAVGRLAASLDRLPSIDFLPGRPRRLIRPNLPRRHSSLDRLLLRTGVALLRRRHQGAVHDPPRHRSVPADTVRIITPGEQPVDGPRPGETLTELPDRFASGTRSPRRSPRNRMNDSRPLIRNSARSSLRPCRAWITRILKFSTGSFGGRPPLAPSE